MLSWVEKRGGKNERDRDVTRDSIVGVDVLRFHEKETKICKRWLPLRIML